MRINLKEAKAIVMLKYPYAKAIEIPPLTWKKQTSKWYQILSPNRVTWVGQGATEREAWISAANYVLEGA